MIWYRDSEKLTSTRIGNLGLCGSYTEPMTVEAQRLNLFSPQIHSNRGMMMMNGIEGIGNVYGAPMGYGVVAPLSGTTTATETPVPMYGSAMTEAFPAETTAIKSNSDLGSLTILAEDFSFQFQQQQLEIDRFIAQHKEKVWLEVEERRKRYSWRIAVAVEDNVMKRLQVKEEEIKKMGKLNWALEERVKSLCVENQIWRDLAQTNEVTTNALRCNLEQVLAQV
ncbi:probable boi-related E3 ubiquitin-protein ligase 3 [Phtheirospermum japonicum]|uniref:Probable boi-related E3 ubiquitin-protein ligase 3 n=1 Tax=Phtheirospermum japonicum TaxID=374723 RepID=A0A830D0A4_9LAMI|nr:probable boi-related E3 ubiquitin-protein ligase 3 [Phtheirospermum japonicum]